MSSFHLLTFLKKDIKILYPFALKGEQLCFRDSKVTLFYRNIVLPPKTLVWHLCQSNVTDKSELLFSYMGPSIMYVRKIFRKTNISNPLIRTRTCAYKGVGNVSFSENFAYVLNGWSPWEVLWNECRYYKETILFRLRLNNYDGSKGFFKQEI